MWEFDLTDGSAWFNDWFYPKLDWHDAERTILGDLQPAVRPAAWSQLMGTFRDHLEKKLPLELDIEVELPSGRLWRGSPAATAAQAPTWLRAASSRTAIEFWLDQGAEFGAAARHLAVTLEDRRTD